MIETTEKKNLTSSGKSSVVKLKAFAFSHEIKQIVTFKLQMMCNYLSFTESQSEWG
jgi:hypothetical protein